MRDKDEKDYCKHCSVEPPAMRFKCPECEHNPDDKNNFEKDINVPHKEQIFTRKFIVSNKDDEGFNVVELNELDRITREIAVKYAKLIDDYIYKNIPTNILQGMKLKIENELLERKLKGNER